MAGAESKGSRRYDKENLLWQSTVAIKSDSVVTRTDLREATGIAPATVSKMSRGESVGAGVLERICASMQCDIGDIVSYVPEPPTSPKGHKRGKEDAS